MTGDRGSRPAMREKGGEIPGQAGNDEGKEPAMRERRVGG